MVEYLHSVGVEDVGVRGFERHELVAAYLRKAGFTIHKCTRDVIEFLGRGDPDINVQAQRVAAQVLRIEGKQVQVQVAPTWVGQVHRGVMHLDSQWLADAVPQENRHDSNTGLQGTFSMMQTKKDDATRREAA